MEEKRESIEGRTGEREGERKREGKEWMEKRKNEKNEG